MAEKSIDKSQVFKDIIEISPISDPRIITRLTVNINDIERTLGMCDGIMTDEIRKVIITYLRVTKQMEDAEKEKN